MGVSTVLEVIFKGTDRTLSRSASSVGDSIGKMGKVIAGGAAIGAAAVVGLGAGLAKLAIDAEPLVGVRDSFRALTREMDGGSQRVLASLQEASAGLITNSDLMESFNKANMLVGKSLTDQLAPAMASIGKVSAATGQDMGFLMDSLVTGIGRLSPMILDNLGIQVSLTEANEAYAASIGKTASELTKAEQQSALMNQVMEKLQTNTALMAAPDQGFAKLKVSVANFKDGLGIMLSEGLSPVLGSLADMGADILPKILEFLDPIVGAFGSFTSLIAAGVEPTEALKTALRTVLPRETMVNVEKFIDVTLPDFIEQVKDAITEVKNFLIPIGEWIDKNIILEDALITLSIVIGVALLTAIVSLGAALLPIIVTLGLITAAVIWVRKNWDKLIPTIEMVGEIWTRILASAKAALDAWMVRVRSRVEEVRVIWETFTTAFDQFKVIWGEIFEVAKGMFDAFKNRVQTRIDEVKDIIGGIGDAISGALGWIQSLIDKISNISLPDFLKRSSPSPFEVTLQGIGSEMENLARNSIPAFAGGLQSIQSNRTNNVNNIWNVNTSGFNAPMEQRAALQHANGGI